MNAWYLSQRRFENRIIKRWGLSGFNWNEGNRNILKYAFRTVLYYANIEKSKLSKANKIDINPKLF